MMCGKRNFGKDWVHVDYENYEHIDSIDIRLPGYKDGSVSLIYCSHGIGYFDKDEIIPILKAWHRVLKPRGTLRIATPDWNALRKLETPLLGPLYGKMNTPPIYHKTIYTKHTLFALLEFIGFYKMRLYDNTRTEHAGFDDHSFAVFNGIPISLNIECNA